MKTVLKGTCYVLSLAVLFSLSSISAAGDNEKGFKPLLMGSKLTAAFDLIGAKDKTWRVEEGVIRCTGKPNGYLATKKSYKNYVIRFDFRYPEKAGNSGYLIHITGKHRVWPKCIEVQGHYNGVCSIFPIGGAKGPRPKLDTKLRNKVRKPHKEWNSVEIVVKNGGIIAKLNGQTVCQAAEGAYSLKGGPIGFQSEGVPIDFRKLRIKVTD